MKIMKNALLLLAGGKGKRYGGGLPKQYRQINNQNFIEYFLSNVSLSQFSIVVIVSDLNLLKKDIKKIKILLNNTKLEIVKPGKNRQSSSFNGLKKLKNYEPKNVLIHDAARPLCSNNLIKKIIKTLSKYDTAIPYVEFNDRKINSSNKDYNENIKFIQTPQGFRYNLIYRAHLKNKDKNFKDDSSLITEDNKKIKFIKGEKSNLKITYKEDIVFFKQFKQTIFRSGIGFDIHKIDYNTKKGLKLCGVNIPHPKLIGHSDADVGYHSICDSIFGALSMKDIGYYFPNNEKKWKNVNSKKFIIYAKKKLTEKKFFVVNLDINFICEKPNINKYSSKMINEISKLLDIPKKIISIKATTNEKLGFIGDGEGIAAETIVQISNEKLY